VDFETPGGGGFVVESQGCVTVQTFVEIEEMFFHFFLVQSLLLSGDGERGWEMS